MIKIIVKNDTLEEFDKAVKLLKKKVNKAGILREVRERRYYEKPGDKIRRKKREAKKERR